MEYTKSLNVPVICFPKGIKKFKIFVKLLSLVLSVLITRLIQKEILKDIQIPVQGGMDQKFY